MTAAYGRAEVPELSVDNREPIVQEREVVLVEVGVPPDLETAGGGLVQIEILREFPSQSLSRISVAPTREQTYIRSLTERQSRPQGPCTDFVEMGAEDQDANKRLLDRHLERGKFQRSSGSVRRMSSENLFPGRKTGEVIVFYRFPISDRGPQEPWADRRLGKSSGDGVVVDDDSRQEGTTCRPGGYAQSEGRRLVVLGRFLKRRIGRPTNRKGAASSARMPRVW